MAEKQRSGPGTREDVEEIMGMFLLTFGQGVNPLHVHLSVVRAMRARLIPPITRALTDPNWRPQWKASAATVLGWMAAVGRLSAQIAMEPKLRRTVIDPSDFETAMDAVMAEHHVQMLGAEEGEVNPLGKWCM
jgi:hypothetical protein